MQQRAQLPNFNLVWYYPQVAMDVKSPAPGGPQDIARNADFWFPDGSIILIDEKSGFRIHQSILSRHSDVFADLFTVPQPQSGTEKMDGCPVVHLTDSATDFIDVMKALYQPL